MNLTALTARLNAFDGFDLSGAECCDLLNEAQVEAARRTRYCRKTVELAAVSGQVAFTLPADFLLPFSVSVGGRPWASSDRQTVRRYEQGELILQDEGVFYEATDEDGNRGLYLYPAPTSAVTVEIEYVYSPPPLNVDEAAGEPTAFPFYWHPKLLPFAAAVYYGTVEDNPELAAFNQEKADLAVSDLERYDNERATGGGSFLVQMPGINA